MTGGDEPGAVRLAELVATLSLATDLGRGEPMEHCLRQTVIALRLADRIGIGERERAATYYTGLLANVYCHADASFTNGDCDSDNDTNLDQHGGADDDANGLPNGYGDKDANPH